MKKTEVHTMNATQLKQYIQKGGLSETCTYVYGKEAVASGLIDKLGGLSDALGALHRMIEKKKKQS